MRQQGTHSRRLSVGLGALQVFIGLGALAGGWAFIADPTGANLGMSVELLSRTPFPDFLIPGVVLFAVNGMGSLAGGIASFLRHRYAGEAALCLGIFLMLWIAIQLAWIGFGLHWLHVLYFILGLVEFVLGILYRARAPRRACPEF